MVSASHEKETGPILTLTRVARRFGAHEVLRGVDLEVDRGRTTVVLGPSGTGKSVLLKLIVGLLRPDAGEIRFNGRRVDVLSERALGVVRRRIGFLFQLSALFDSMTVAENLDFPLREHTRQRRSERRRRIRAALDHVDLAGIESRFPAELSGGQRKRVALARATMLEPELILYDEPTTGLDPVRADGINRLVRRMQADLGVTGVVVTHDLASAAAVGDRVIMLDGGTIIADGRLEDLRVHTDARVRHFLQGRYTPGVEQGGSTDA